MGTLIKISELSRFSALQCETLDVSYQHAGMEVGIDILLVCNEPNKLVAYLNQCPHTGVNLNWQQNQCFDFTQSYLICSLHGALFQPEDGLCIAGPCCGQSLLPITLVIKADEVFIDPELVIELTRKSQ